MSGAVKKAAAATVTSRPTLSHPSTAVMVTAAIKSSTDRKGTTLPTIKKYLAVNYQVDPVKKAPYIRKYLKSAVDRGDLIQTNGTGAAGNFKLPPVKVKKPVVKKKPVVASATKVVKKKQTAKKPNAAAVKTTTAAVTSGKRKSDEITKKKTTTTKAAGSKKPKKTQTAAVAKQKVAKIVPKAATVPAKRRSIQSSSSGREVRRKNQHIKKTKM